MNKKGIFFTLIAILVTSIAIFLFALGSREAGQDDAIRIRINTMNNFINDFELDMQRALHIAAFRTTLGLEQNIIQEGVFLSDVKAAFTEAILNGSYNQIPMTVLNNATLPDWETRIKKQAEKIKIEVNLTINDIDVVHKDSWNIEVRINATINLKDKDGLAQWTVEKEIASELSIIGFEDPLYPLNSLGRITNIINKTPFTDFVQGDDTTNLQKHLNDSFYIAHNDAPSFLMRLTGNLSASPYGIESLVNLEDFSDQGLPTKARSAVDYIYFGNQATTDFYIENMPSWFKVDQDHLQTYEVQDLTK